MKPTRVMVSIYRVGKDVQVWNISFKLVDFRANDNLPNIERHIAGIVSEIDFDPPNLTPKQQFIQAWHQLCLSIKLMIRGIIK